MADIQVNDCKCSDHTHTQAHGIVNKFASLPRARQQGRLSWVVLRNTAGNWEKNWRDPHSGHFTLLRVGVSSPKKSSEFLCKRYLAASRQCGSQPGLLVLNHSVESCLFCWEASLEGVVPSPMKDLSLRWLSVGAFLFKGPRVADVHPPGCSRFTGVCPMSSWTRTMDQELGPVQSSHSVFSCEAESLASLDGAAACYWAAEVMRL